MKIKPKVFSTVKPKEVEFDDFHVYLHTNIQVVPEEERINEKAQLKEGQTLKPLYSYKVKEYEKDEFLLALSTGQLTLDNRATALEDMMLEISQKVFVD